MHQASQTKKLVSVLATSTLVTVVKKAQKVRVLDRVACIYYPMQLQKEKSKDILALLNSESKVNAISSAYTAQLGLGVQKTNIAAQKIDRFSLKTFSIVISAFQFFDNFSCSQFF